MMTALATVTSVTNTASGVIASLSCEQKTSCNHCQSQKSCGTGIVTKALGSKSHSWTLKTSHSLVVGQIIEIGLPEKGLIQSALVVYMLPLVCMILGSLFGQFGVRPLLGYHDVDSGEWVVIAMFFLFGLLGGLSAKPLTRYLEQQADTQVSFIRSLGLPLSDDLIKLVD